MFGRNHMLQNKAKFVELLFSHCEQVTQEEQMYALQELRRLPVNWSSNFSLAHSILNQGSFA
jgi:hypothetical protein